MGGDAVEVVGPPSGSDLLLDVAQRLFLQQGYANVSMQAIAREAGMTKGAPYYYFPSKEALFLAVSRRVLGSLRDAMQTALSGDRPLRERLCAALEVVVSPTGIDASTWLTDMKLVMKAADTESLVNDLIGSDDISMFFLPTLRDARARGEVNRVSPEVAARVITRLMLACMTEGSYWRQAGKPDAWNPDLAIRESVDIFLLGVTAAP